MKSSKYIKKPVEIEAIQWTGDNIEDIKEFCNQCTLSNDELIIFTLEGKMIASINDYIIKGVKGEFYPCKPDIFKTTYDEVKETTFIDRLLIEEKELFEKIDKLDEFILHNPIFDSLDEDMKTQMFSQINAMKIYHQALSNRLALLGVSGFETVKQG